ncbi:hypothetical protein TNCV_597361 [Trichonephila clavipes]|nr:hypothetical protein TNCV_597361 [Trichonephila clavipes]
MSSHSSCRTALRVRILNVWIGRHDLRISIRLAARTYHQFRLSLQDEWAAMPQQLIDTLILFMLAVRGDHITKDRMFLAGHP